MKLGLSQSGGMGINQHQRLVLTPHMATRVAQDSLEIIPRKRRQTPANADNRKIVETTAPPDQA
jgi:hypothetical protein